METGDKNTFHCSGLMSNSFGIFQEMQRKEEFCDITIRFGDHSISAHRNVVAAAIPYFREKVSSQEFETDRKEIIIGELDACALESVVAFAYTSTVEITTETVNTLLAAACFLRVNPVRDACCDFIAQRLNPENVVSIRQLAKSLGCSSLVESSNLYICKNFDKVSTSEKFLDEPFSDIKELISRDYLQTSNEENVLESIMKWVKKSPVERKSLLSELLRYVRMSVLTIDYLTACLGEDLIRNSIPCRDMVEEARTFHILPHRRPLIFSFKTTARGQMKTALGRQRNLAPGVYAIRCEVRKCHPPSAPVHSLQYFTDESSGWDIVNSLPFTPCTASCALVVGNDKMYFYDSGYVRSYDPATGNWNRNKTYVGHRLNAGIALLHNKLYICGGSDEDAPFLNTVLCFDLENNLFLDVQNMPFRSSGPGIVVLDGLYVLGGKNETADNGCLSSVYKYNLVSKKWTKAASMKSSRYAMGCATLNGKIYVCGGKSKSNVRLSTEVYDPLSNKWSTVSWMNIERYDFSLVSYDGKLYALGGKDKFGKSLNTVEIYDTEINGWKFGTALDPSSRLVKATSVTQTTIL